MSKEIWIGILITAGVAGWLTYYYGLWPRQAAAPPAAGEAEMPFESAIPPPAAVAIQHPVPESQAPEQPLPALPDSDEPFRGELQALYGEPPVESFLVPKNVIVRVVATIDSLDRKEPVAMKMRAVPAVPEKFAVDQSGGRTVAGAGNRARYEPFITALQSVDGKTVGELYLRYYPLFQQAYVELGYPEGYFNDRLIAVIDHLLETPEPERPPALVRHIMVWRFADPNLEALSSGQKALLRLGPQHAAAVKAKLGEMRAAISSPAAEQQPLGGNP